MAMTSVEPQPERLNNFEALLQEVSSDFVESERRLKLVAYTLAGMGTIAINAAKLPLVAVPSLALEALKYSESPLVSGLVTGAVFGTWTYGAAYIIDAAGQCYPNLKSAFRERFPRISSKLSDSLPGFTTNEVPPNRMRMARIGKNILTHARRGMTVLGIGAGFYVGAAQLEERPNEEIGRLRRLTAGDAALMIGTLSCATTSIVTKIGESNPVLADQIQERATDTKTLVGLALGLIVGQGLNRWRHSRHDN